MACPDVVAVALCWVTVGRGSVGGVVFLTSPPLPLRAISGLESLLNIQTSTVPLGGRSGFGAPDSDRQIAAGKHCSSTPPFNRLNGVTHLLGRSLRQLPRSGAVILRLRSTLRTPLMFTIANPYGGDTQASRGCLWCLG